MRKFINLLLACLWVGTPLSAQDNRADDFATAMDMFFPKGNGALDRAMVAGAFVLDDISGTWFEASLLFADGKFDPDKAARICAVRTLEIERTGQFEFTMSVKRKGTVTAATVSYAYSGFNTFSRSANIEGYLDLRHPDRAEKNMNDMVLFGGFNQRSLHGRAIVLRPTPDLLVIQGLDGPSRILMQCPQ